MSEDVIIIGGGPAGILASYHLKRFGVDSLILEGKKTGQSWREMRDGMVMLSPAVASHDMTSLAFENPIWSLVKLNGPFATKEEFVEYLDLFVKKEGIKVLEGKEVAEVRKDGNGFAVETGDGFRYLASVVVVATGVIGNPCLPDIRGIDGNRRVVHSRNYKGFDAYRGKRVLIVGAGNSGTELTIELSGIARVTLINREKLKFYSRTRDLSHIRGLSESLLKELIQFKIVELKEKIRVTKVEGGRVTFSDGTGKEFDEIIFATGYHANLPKFRDISVRTTRDGYPKVSGRCESASVDGLYFTGPLAHRLKDCAFIHCFRSMVEPMALDIAEKLGH